MHYSWAWGTCLVPPLSLSCCGWQCASHTSVVSLTCIVLPWRVTKLSVLSRWHWMCCIAGERCCARAWFSWKFSTPSWNNFISQQSQFLLLGDPRYSQFVFCSSEPRLGVGRLGEQDAEQHQPSLCVVSTQVVELSSSLEGNHPLLPAWESLTPEPPSRADFSPPLQLQAGCCWADAEAAGRRWPQSRPLALEVPGWSRPAPRSASAGKEAHTAGAGKVPWGPGSPQEPTISSFSSALSLLPSLPFQVEPLEGFLTACSGVFFRGTKSLAARGRMGTDGARAYQQDFLLWG